MKVGILVTSSFVTEVNKFEYFKIPSAKKPWLDYTPKALRFHHQESTWKKPYDCVTSDGAILSYLLWKCNNAANDVLCRDIQFEAIFPRDLTIASSKKYGIIFCPMVDILEYATIAPSYERKRFNRVLSNLKNIFPSYSVQKLINDKGAYYNFFQRQGIPMIDTLVFRPEHVKTSRVLKQTINKIRHRARKNKWTQIVVKPNTGQEGIRFSVLPENVDDDRLANALEDILQSYSGVLVQKYIKGFDKKTMEHRIYTIDEKYAYTVLTQRTVDTPRLVVEEGGNIRSPFWKAAKALAAKACRLMPKTKINGIKLPNMLMRSDIGYTATASAKSKTWKPELFLSEQEFVPSLYARECPKGVHPEMLVGEAILRILHVFLTRKGCTQSLPKHALSSSYSSSRRKTQRRLRSI